MAFRSRGEPAVWRGDKLQEYGATRYYSVSRVVERWVGLLDTGPKGSVPRRQSTPGRSRQSPSSSVWT